MTYHINSSAIGLTEEEQAFYDALTQPQAVRDFYENEQLVAMTKELTEMLRNSKTLDWRLKESARANMRRMVKRLLRKYNYPPKEVQQALDTVIRQCELWVEEEYDPMVNNYNVTIINGTQNNYPNNPMSSFIPDQKLCRVAKDLASQCENKQEILIKLVPFLTGACDLSPQIICSKGFLDALAENLKMMPDITYENLRKTINQKNI